MRYTEQIKYSWSYHWGLFREIWDMFTLYNKHWVIVGLLAVLCVLPGIIASLTPHIGLYFRFIKQEVILDAHFLVIPSKWQLVNYYWVVGSGFVLLTNVLCIASVGLLLVAYLREGSPVRGREE